MVWARQRSPVVPGVSGPLGLHCVGACPCLCVCGSQGRSEREARREGAEIMVRALRDGERHGQWRKRLEECELRETGLPGGCVGVRGRKTETRETEGVDMEGKRVGEAE